MLTSSARSCGLGRFLSVVVAAIFTGPAVAGGGLDVAWVNPDGGLFADLDNWNPTIVPGPTDNVLFDLGSSTPYEVEFSQSRSSGRGTLPWGLDLFPAFHAHPCLILPVIPFDKAPHFPSWLLEYNKNGS